MPRVTARLYAGRAPGAQGETPEDQPQITVHPLPGPPRACMIICPGGGYGLRDDRSEFIPWFARQGIASAILAYRIAPYPHPQPLQDLLRAIRLLRHGAEAWNIDATRIGVMGFSAGGHLAGCAASLWTHGAPDSADAVEHASSRPDAVLLGFPLISFGEHRNHGSMLNLLGEQASCEVARRTLSLEHQVTAETSPAFLWHSADDLVVPVENSLLYAAALSRARVPFALHVFTHGEHGMGLCGDESELGSWSLLAQRWLAGRGFAQRAGVPAVEPPPAHG